jgi:hypothetical protein
VYPLRKMALNGVLGRKASPNSINSNEKSYEKDQAYDAEAAAGNPIPNNDASSDASFSIGKQIEMEANNAIKYRTCSWQKVHFQSSLPCRCANPCIRLQPCSFPSTFVWP